MAVAKLDSEVTNHQEWIGFVRPTGLVVSAPALVQAGAILDRRDAEGQRLLRSCLDDGSTQDARAANEVRERYRPETVDVEPRLVGFRTFAETVLAWSFSARAYAGTPDCPVPEELELRLPDYGEVLRPDFAVRELEPRDGAPGWQLLVRVLDPNVDLDTPIQEGGQLDASPHSRMERLLRHTSVPAGLIYNGRTIRLLSAPRGESSGWLDFRVADMLQTAGRPICTAMRLLLGQTALLARPRHQRLPALLEDSRKFQNEVSERLAQQVLHALYELLRGFQAAHDASRGALLRQPLAEHPDEVYRALLTVILRLVFLLYAEERDMLPGDETFLRYYSLAGLYERLREDAALFPDTMDQRFGAWAQLLALFRMVYDGADAGETSLPERHGVLFDPDRFPFLEGRAPAGARQLQERIEPPLVPDGTIYRALEKLLVLDGERISYRALDVEQIGSVYETMMGFRLEIATGRSVAIKSQKKQGAPAAVDLEAMLAEPASKREKWLQDRVGRKLTDTARRAASGATTLEDLHAALLSMVDVAATPDLVPAGAMLLQPSEERRRSGSHYTPRALTQPIVRTTLEPILARLRGADGASPLPAQILELKVCDPAMGSGAFLVEACRQLGDALIEAWHTHDQVPAIPPDEDEVIFARRMIAKRCLYGVDRNPVAVDLAKVSLWLATLAKDHALTFVDHALRHGDSLVGLSRRQIEAFQWEPTGAILQGLKVREPVDKALELRRRIRDSEEENSDEQLRGLWAAATDELSKVRYIGDLILAAFFEEDKPAAREMRRSEYASAVLNGVAERLHGRAEDLRLASTPLVPFHWQIEFPETFERENPGFDAIIGNPPFLGGVGISRDLGMPYFSWLSETYSPAGHQCDLVAYFFRRAFDLLRRDGTFGLIATNTISQGDTREGGLREILKRSGEIYSATRRVRWPGVAAVVVSVVHVIKGQYSGSPQLGGAGVSRVSSYLVGGYVDDAPLALKGNPLFTQGSAIAGQGFLFDDLDEGATPIAIMHRVLEQSPHESERVLPYIGGQELNNDPHLKHRRYVIYLSDLKEETALIGWPELARIVRAKVRPERERLGPNPNNVALKRRWWAYHAHRPEFYAAANSVERVLAINCGATPHVAFGFLPSGMIYAKTLAVFVLDTYSAFGVLQSRAHEVWARAFGSSMKDDLRYTPSDCFETFPFPVDWQTNPSLEAVGTAYYEFRAEFMGDCNTGLTKTYNRFHDPEERDVRILRLRELHSAMDRAVLNAYGWSDLPIDCEFLLDYAIDEDSLGSRKKPWRYRWPEDVRDEVIGRLLELNAERAREEARSGANSREAGSKASRRRGPKESNTMGLFS
jgi:hypothetical protein